MLNQIEILKEKEINLKNFVPNLHLLLKEMFQEEKKFNSGNDILKITRDQKNGLILHFKEENETYTKNLDDILCEYF